MNTETIEIDGYTVTIAQDQNAENPFDNFDCEPPLLVYSLARHTGQLDTYNGAPDCIADFVRLLPDSCFARGKRMALIKELSCGVKEFALTRKESGFDVGEAFAEILTDEMGAKPEGWRSATAWFEMAESLLKRAGIPCHSTESHGYCQGDTVKLLALATPEWAKLVGAPLDSCESQCESACNLYAAWAWGDVYGIESITTPDGEELRDGSVWGFYGSDHETSGLLESARDTIAAHKRYLTKEAAEREDAACRDSVTVG